MAIQSQTVEQEQQCENRSEFKNVMDGRTEGRTDGRTYRRVQLFATREFVLSNEFHEQKNMW